MQTCSHLKLFTKPMDRAELLHSTKYDIILGRKNTPDKIKFVQHIENLTFPNISTTYVPPQLPLNMPDAL